jgi:hypothetical protein
MRVREKLELSDNVDIHPFRDSLFGFGYLTHAIPANKDSKGEPLHSVFLLNVRVPQMGNLEEGILLAFQPGLLGKLPHGCLLLGLPWLNLSGREPVGPCQMLRAIEVPDQEDLAPLEHQYPHRRYDVHMSPAGLSRKLARTR